MLLAEQYGWTLPDVLALRPGQLRALTEAMARRARSVPSREMAGPAEDTARIESLRQRMSGRR